MLLPVQFTFSPEKRKGEQQRDIIPKLLQTRLQTPLSRAKATTRSVEENPTEEAIKLLKSLPRSKLEHLGIKIDMDIVQQEAQLPVGGRLAHFAKNRREITNNPWILEMIQGYQVEFHSTPQQVGCPNEICLDATQSQALTKEFKELVRKEAIIAAPVEQRGFTSQMFLVPKPDGSWRPMINLNSYIVT